MIEILSALALTYIAFTLVSSLKHRKSVIKALTTNSDVCMHIQITKK